MISAFSNLEAFGPVRYEAELIGRTIGAVSLTWSLAMSMWPKRLPSFLEIWQDCPILFDDFCFGVHQCRRFLASLYPAYYYGRSLFVLVRPHRLLMTLLYCIGIVFGFLEKFGMRIFFSTRGGYVQSLRLRDHSSLY